MWHIPRFGDERGGPSLHTQPIFRSLMLLVALFSFTGVAFAQSADLVIVHVTIINPAAGKPRPDMTIVIRGRNIVSVAPSKDLKLPSRLPR